MNQRHVRLHRDEYGNDGRDEVTLHYATCGTATTTRRGFNHRRRTTGESQRRLNPLLDLLRLAFLVRLQLVCHFHPSKAQLPSQTRRIDLPVLERRGITRNP